MEMVYPGATVIRNLFMDSNTKNYYWGGLAFFVLFVIFSVVNKSIESKKALKWHFKGPVEYVYYNDKNTPHVVINHKKYDLFYAIWDKSIKINVGDTLIKQKGSLFIKLIRKNGTDTLYDHRRR